MDKIDSFYTQFKNEMERSLKEKDIQINALQASNLELKEHLETKEKIIEAQARQIRKIQDDMKNTFARARGLQMLKDINDPEGQKKKRKEKELETKAIEDENARMKSEYESLKSFVGNLQGVIQRLMITQPDGISNPSTFENEFGSPASSLCSETLRNSL